MITIKLTNKTAYTLILILAVLTTTLVVYAANPTTKPNPGHASQEIMVNIAGTDKTLQAAIDAGDFGGGGSTNCRFIESYPGVPTDGLPWGAECNPNEYVAGVAMSACRSSDACVRRIKCCTFS